jgi:prepilin-type N-terminal cleavage/methylation domain-containing protein
MFSFSPRNALKSQVSAFRLSRKRAAFTLIELLIVVAIIAILAGLSFGALQGALKSSKRAQARNDVNQVASAVKAYTLEYGRLPASGEVIAQLTGANPKGIVFLEAKPASGKPLRNGTSGGNLLDPWGQPYTVALDEDYDNKMTFEGQEFLTTVIVSSPGDETFSISSVKGMTSKK